MWLDYLTRCLPDRGWEPVVGLVSGRWHNVDRYLEAYPSLPWVSIHNPTGSTEGRRRALATVVRKEAPDAVVGVNIADVYSACHRVRQEGGKPFSTIMTFHGIADDLLGDLKRECDHIDGVIGTNQLACLLCSELAGMAAERICYAPYGVDVEGLGAITCKERIDGPLKIAYVGRLDNDQKRVEMIPRILRFLDENCVDFEIDIAGDGPMRESLQRSLSPWLRNGRANMLGAVSQRAVSREIYVRADVLLVTSSWETGPIVIWEAMAAGVAVVTSKYVGCGLEGALKHGKNCLMYPVDDTRTAAQLLERLADKDEAKKLATEGRRLVVERYSIEESVRAWAEALDRLVTMGPKQISVAVTPPLAAGRLDVLLGTRWGETLRRCCGVSFSHSSAGGEWPHTLAPGTGQATLLQAAEHLDIR